MATVSPVLFFKRELSAFTMLIALAVLICGCVACAEVDGAGLEAAWPAFGVDIIAALLVLVVVVVVVLRGGGQEISGSCGGG